MKQEIEQKLRTENPQLVVGLDEQKVKDAVGTITDRIGKVGKTVVLVKVVLTDTFLSVRELNMLAHKLKHHSLRISSLSVEDLWYHHSSATHKQTL